MSGKGGRKSADDRMRSGAEMDVCGGGFEDGAMEGRGCCRGGARRQYLIGLAVTGRGERK